MGGCGSFLLLHICIANALLFCRAAASLLAIHVGSVGLELSRPVSFSFDCDQDGGSLCDRCPRPRARSSMCACARLAIVLSGVSFLLYSRIPIVCADTIDECNKK